MFNINCKIIEVIKEIKYEEISFLNSKVSNLELAILIIYLKHISKLHLLYENFIPLFVFSLPQEKEKIKKKDSTKGGTLYYSLRIFLEIVGGVFIFLLKPLIHKVRE